MCLVFFLFSERGKNTFLDLTFRRTPDLPLFAAVALHAKRKHAPQFVVGQRGGYVYHNVRNRVLEPNPAGQQAYAAVGIAARRAVLQVALYGAAHCGELAANLVVPAGYEVYFQKVVPVGAGYEAVIEHCELGVLGAFARNVSLVVLGIPHQVLLQMPLVLLRAVGRYGPIGLAYHPAAAQHVVKARKGLARARKEHEPLRGAVEAVHRAEEHLAGLGVALLDIRLHIVGKRAVARAVALHYLAGLLVDYYYMVVFVNYLHKARFFH